MATGNVRFEARLYAINDQAVLRLPATASKKLPSRGQVAVTGTLNRQSFETVIEPDGEFGHWMKVDAKLQKAAGLRLGDVAVVELEPADEWPEPRVPLDLKKALASAPEAVRDLWKAITPMARWEWVRWVNATRNPETRLRRIEVTLSKMSKGSRRPCCFNLASCTDPDLSKSGKLIDQG